MTVENKVWSESDTEKKNTPMIVSSTSHTIPFNRNVEITIFFGDSGSKVSMTVSGDELIRAIKNAMNTV